MSLKNKEELPLGGLIEEAGNAAEYETGGWRTYRPIWDFDKCIHCLTCWICCPDSCIIVEEEKVKGADLRFCKGCGVCANECPKKINAIKMEEEVKFKE